MLSSPRNKSKKMIDRKDKLITKLFIEICSVAYYFRRFLGGQRGTRAKLSRMLKTLARTGTILSSYLRNRNLWCSLLFSVFYQGTNREERETVADTQNASANWNEFVVVPQKS